MDQQFQAIIEAAVQQAKLAESLLWADDIAERIVSYTPLSVRVADISEQLSREAARMGVAVTVTERRRALRQEGCERASA